MHTRISETLAYVELKYLLLNKKWHEADNERERKRRQKYPKYRRHRRNSVVNLFRRNSSYCLEKELEKDKHQLEILQTAVLRLQSKMSK